MPPTPFHSTCHKPSPVPSTCFTTPPRPPVPVSPHPPVLQYLYHRTHPSSSTCITRHPPVPQYLYHPTHPSPSTCITPPTRPPAPVWQPLPHPSPVTMSQTCPTVPNTSVTNLHSPTRSPYQCHEPPPTRTSTPPTRSPYQCHEPPPTHPFPIPVSRTSTAPPPPPFPIPVSRTSTHPPRSPYQCHKPPPAHPVPHNNVTNLPPTYPPRSPYQCHKPPHTNVTNLPSPTPYQCHNIAPPPPPPPPPPPAFSSTSVTNSLSARPFVCLSVCLPVSVFLSPPLPVCLSVSVFLSPPLSWGKHVRFGLTLSISADWLFRRAQQLLCTSSFLMIAITGKVRNKQTNWCKALTPFCAYQDSFFLFFSLSSILVSGQDPANPWHS